MLLTKLQKLHPSAID
jgi:hypothetical protein